MAGTGPLPKNAAQRQRRNQSATKATLQVVEDPDIPELPPAEHWLSPMFDKANDTWVDPEWRPHVVAWWESIWSSPMSSEYDDADIHGLYLACMYLQESTNPMLKAAERISYGKNYEAAVRNYGLTPMSRRSLQWEIARSNEATEKAAEKANQKKAAKDAQTRPAGVTSDEDDPRYPRAVTS